MQNKCYTCVKVLKCQVAVNQVFDVFEFRTQRNSQYNITYSIFEKRNRYGTEHHKRQQSGK